MKKQPLLHTLLAAAGLALGSSGTAFAGGFDTAIFLAADLDLSGSLNNTEFYTTLDVGLSARAQAKAFRRADLNRNASIEVNEWLISVGQIQPGNRWERLFYQADVDIDGSLTFDEFTGIYPRRMPLVNVRRFFLRADVNLDSSITLQEFLDLRGGATQQNNFTIFQLADFNGNGQLTVEEFGNFYARTANTTKIQLKFTRLDTNLDGFLTTDEWNPGVRP